MYSFKKINIKYSKKIQQIWINSLPKNIYSIFGCETIQIYLKYFFLNQKNIAFGVFKKSEMIGFVLYGSDNSINNTILKKHFLFLFFNFVKSIFNDLKNLFFFIDVVIFYLFFNKDIKDDSLIELLIICMDKNYMNKGLGSKLLDYTTSIINKNFKNIIVKTLKKEFKNLNFYKKNSFDIIENQFGRIWLKRRFY